MINCAARQAPAWSLFQIPREAYKRLSAVSAQHQTRQSFGAADSTSCLPPACCFPPWGAGSHLYSQILLAQDTGLCRLFCWSPSRSNRENAASSSLWRWGTPHPFLMHTLWLPMHLRQWSLASPPSLLTSVPNQSLELVHSSRALFWSLPSSLCCIIVITVWDLSNPTASPTSIAPPPPHPSRSNQHLPCQDTGQDFLWAVNTPQLSWNSQPSLVQSMTTPFHLSSSFLPPTLIFPLIKTLPPFHLWSLPRLLFFNLSTPPIKSPSSVCPPMTSKLPREALTCSKCCLLIKHFQAAFVHEAISYLTFVLHIWSLLYMAVWIWTSELLPLGINHTYRTPTVCPRGMMVLHPHPCVCTADSPPSSRLLPPAWIPLTVTLGVLLFTEKEIYLLSPVHWKWKWKLLSLVQLFATPWTIQPMEFSRPAYQSSLSLFQGIFPTQGSNPGLPHCTWILYQMSHKGSPRILEWVAYPFSRGSSRPRNWTRISCIAGEFFTNWTIREAQYVLYIAPSHLF